ncbi:MAG: porin [Myxococcales bacterium]
MRSKDGAYVLRIALQVGLKVEPEWTDGDAQFNSTFAFLRPIIRGNFYRPWLGYRLSFEANSGTPRVFDAYFDVAPLEEFAFRFGQQATPVSRHENFGPQQIFFPDFAAVASYFWSGRERGLTVYGGALSDILEYYAGIYAGSPIDEPVNLPKNYVVEARLTLNPLGAVNANEMPFTPDGDRLPTRFSFTLQGYQGKLQTAQENFNAANNFLTPAHSIVTEKLGTAAADVWFQAHRLILFGEFYWRRVDPVGGGTSAYGSYGAWGQAVFNLYKNLLGIGARCGWMNPSTDLANDQSTEVEAQLAYFIHPPELVLKLRYAWLKQKSPDLADAPYGFVLPFAEGKSNLATLQLMMAF